MFKTENETWSFLVKEFTDVLREYGYNDWVVLRNYQPSVQGLQDKAVYLYKVSKRRIGTQGFNDELDNGGDWQTVDHWYEETLYQVSAFKQRNPQTETVDTITSEDVLSVLWAHVNSALKVMRWKEKGYEAIKSTNMRLMDYETDSGIQEKMPQFDFLLLSEQSNLKKIGKIDNIEATTKRV